MWQGRGRQETPKDSESRLRSARVRPRPPFSCSLALGSGVQLRGPVPRGSNVGPERNESGLGLQGWWLNCLQHKSESVMGPVSRATLKDGLPKAGGKDF